MENVVGSIDEILVGGLYVPPNANSTIKIVKQPKNIKNSTEKMVLESIKNLAERNGSSLHAIKKYINANYLVNINKTATHIKIFLRSAVLNGKLVQTKGKGAGGSFKLPKPKPLKAITKKTVNRDPLEAKKTAELSKKAVKKNKNATAKPAPKNKTVKKAENTEPSNIKQKKAVFSKKLKAEVIATQDQEEEEENDQEEEEEVLPTNIIVTVTKKGKNVKRKSLKKVVGVEVNTAMKRTSVGGKPKLIRQVAMHKKDDETPTTSKKITANKMQRIRK